MMAKAKPKKKKKRPCRERSPESEETDFRTFNLQRIAPEAHRLQNQEFEMLMDTARHVNRTMSQQEIKKIMGHPTWALRKWRRENLKHGHFTWREEFSLLQVMRGNDAGALHDDQGNCSDPISDFVSEDDEPIANVCCPKPTEDEKPAFLSQASVIVLIGAKRQRNMCRNNVSMQVMSCALWMIRRNLQVMPCAKTQTRSTNHFQLLLRVTMQWIGSSP